MADVQIAVGLRRETGVDGHSLELTTLCDVLVDKVQNKVFTLRYLLGLGGTGLSFLGHCLTLLIVSLWYHDRIILCPDSITERTIYYIRFPL